MELLGTNKTTKIKARCTEFLRSARKAPILQIDCSTNCLYTVSKGITSCGYRSYGRRLACLVVDNVHGSGTSVLDEP